MRLRISEQGVISGLWSDAIDWSDLGRVAVRRASHVEFCERRQQWYVSSASARNALRKLIGFVLLRPSGRILYWAQTRREALDWEERYFGPGGKGWSDRQRSVVENPFMRIIGLILAALAGMWRHEEIVRDHSKRQAVGPGWAQHRLRRIGRYTRRKPRRGRG